MLLLGQSQENSWRDIATVQLDPAMALPCVWPSLCMSHIGEHRDSASRWQRADRRAETRKARDARRCQENLEEWGGEAALEI